MKHFTFLTTLIVTFTLLTFSASLQAQQKSSDEVTVTQKIESEDGQVIIKKKRIEKGSSLDAFLEALELEKAAGTKMDIIIGSDDFTPADNKDDMEQTMFYFRRGKSGNEVEGQENLNKEMDELRISMHDNMRVHPMTKSQLIKRSKTLLGVYPAHPVDQGLVIGSVVRGKGAEAAGLKGGDILLMVAGQKISKTSDIQDAIGSYKAGQVVDVVYERNGNIETTQVELSESISYSYTVERDPCKVFIGVYTSTSTSSKGVRVTGIIPNTPAEEAGLQRGDIILSMDGIQVETHDELLVERNKHQPGDQFVIQYTRNGNSGTVTAKFKDCEQEKEELAEALPETISEEDGPTNLEERGLTLEEFTAFPNPTVGPLTVAFRAEPVPTILRITDLSGKVVYEENIQNFDGFYNKNLDLYGNAPGNLSVSVMQNGKAASKNILLLNRA